MNAEQLQSIVAESISAESILASGEGGKFEVEISSDLFTGLNTLKRHQMVYKAVNEFISSGELHALTIKAYTPEEYQQR